MRLEVLNGFSRFTPNLESEPVTLVQLEGRRKKRRQKRRSQRQSGEGRKFKPVKAIMNPFGTAKKFISGEDKQAERKSRRKARRKARRQRRGVLSQSREGQQRANRQRAVRISNNPKASQIRSKRIPKGINGLRPEVAEDLKQYCMECQMNGVTPTMDDFLNGKKERAERRRKRRAERERKRAERERKKLKRTEQKEKRRDERIERKDRRADRKEDRQTRRQERKQQRQDRKDLRITERRERQEARQQARQDRVEARNLRRADRQEARERRQEARGEKWSQFGENITGVANRVLPGLVSGAERLGIDVPDAIEDFRFGGPQEEGLTKAGAERQGKEDNFLKKYGLIIAGVGVGAFLLLRNQKGKKKR
jgi:hypothetical protein